MDEKASLLNIGKACNILEFFCSYCLVGPSINDRRRCQLHWEVHLGAFVILVHPVSGLANAPKVTGCQPPLPFIVPSPAFSLVSSFLLYFLPLLQSDLDFFLHLVFRKWPSKVGMVKYCLLLKKVISIYCLHFALVALVHYSNEVLGRNHGSKNTCKLAFP